MYKKITILALGFLVLAVLTTVVTITAVDKMAEHSCETYRQETGRWVKYIKWNGCFVLLENQYLVKKDDLLPTDEPELDPEIVGAKAAAQDDIRKMRTR